MRTRTRGRADDPLRIGAALVAAFAGGAAGFIAVHHPLAPALMVAALVGWSVIACLRPAAWLFVVPALLPVIDLAPWTGWLMAEELDLLVLGAAAGGYAAIAIRGLPPRGDTGRMSGLAVWLIVLCSLSTAVGLLRGVSSATTTEFHWFDGYYSAQNSLRLAKGFGSALLMLPLFRIELRRSPARSPRRLAWGIAVGLGTASLAVLWERAAFPGILNFSSDYRATGSFWEMHVGGAALDGFLALAFPFALGAFADGARRGRWIVAGALVLLGGYACLATFSRGLYLALPVSLGVLALLLLRQREPHARGVWRALGMGGALAALVAAAAFVVFRAGGYRAVAATLGVFALALPLAAVGRRLHGRWLVAALAGGLVLGVIGGLAGRAIGKGPYIVFGVLVVAAGAAIASAWRNSGVHRAGIAVGAWTALAVAAAAVAYGWGGVAALRDAALVLLLIALLLLRQLRTSAPPWPHAPALHASIVGGVALIGIATAVFSGGSYMAARLTATERDLDERIAHWHRVAALLATPGDVAFGKGLGRFPQSYLFDARDGEFPGSYRTEALDGKRSLLLSGPARDAGAEELFRIGQRIPGAGPGAYQVRLEARTPADAVLYIELCERNLLYGFTCRSAPTKVRRGSVWRRLAVDLTGPALRGGSWYAPRPLFFALAVDTPERVIEIGEVSVVGPGGRELIANGDFADDLARWFPTSDRLHLAWHAKNMALALLFDQGILGLGVFALLVAAALGHVALGRARGHPLAPYLAAGLTGFLVVGLFDSLIDAPRVAFLFFFLVLASHALPATSAERPGGRDVRTA